MNQLVEHGKVTRGYLGVHIQDVTPALAQQFGFNQGGGVLDRRRFARHAGSQGGTEKGRRGSRRMNGHTVEAANQLQVQISQMAPGSRQDKVWRDGKSQDSSHLGELPEKAGELPDPDETSEGALEGVEVQNLTSDLAQQLNLPSEPKASWSLPRLIPPVRRQPPVSTVGW